MLSLHQIDKSYTAPVLRGLCLDVQAGQIHGLVGPNGAGKTTLCNVVAGIIEPDRGTVRINGREVQAFTSEHARHLGVRYVHQELNLLPTLTVAENLFFQDLPSHFGFVARGQLERDAHVALAQVGMNALEPATPVADLGVGERQLIEIASALVGDCRILILDEPTAALSEAESSLLFEQVRRIASTGVAVLYISHKLEEVVALCDRVSVLRDGRLIGTSDADGLTPDLLLDEITGATERSQTAFVSHRQSKVALQVNKLYNAAVTPFCVDVFKGERVGIAGLVGSGRSELLRLIYGADPGDGGEIVLAGVPRAPFRSPRDAMCHGVGFVSEDRKLDGLLMSQSVEGNTNLIRLLHSHGWVDSARCVERARQWCKKLNVRYRSLAQPVGELSGGNQQKVVLAKWLNTNPQILLLDEPTRGVDAAARGRIHETITELAKAGVAIVMVSSDLSELMAHCDRILTVSSGKVSETFERDTWQSDEITRAMFGEVEQA